MKKCASSLASTNMAVEDGGGQWHSRSNIKHLKMMRHFPPTLSLIVWPAWRTSVWIWQSTKVPWLFNKLTGRGHQSHLCQLCKKGISCPRASFYWAHISWDHEAASLQKLWRGGRVATEAEWTAAPKSARFHCELWYNKGPDLLAKPADITCRIGRWVSTMAPKDKWCRLWRRTTFVHHQPGSHIHHRPRPNLHKNHNHHLTCQIRGKRAQYECEASLPERWNWNQIFMQLETCGRDRAHLPQENKANTSSNSNEKQNRLTGPHYGYAK